MTSDERRPGTWSAPESAQISLREAGEKCAEQLGGLDAKPVRGVAKIS